MEGVKDARVVRKKPNEKLCAERIYEALADGEIGDMTAEKLRLPKETRARYGENTLHYREAVTLCALLEVADKQPTTLHPVLQEYENLLETKRTGRGLNVGSREFRYAPSKTCSELKTNPYRWAQRWLTEFRNNPDDNFMVALFADHWLQ